MNVYVVDNSNYLTAWLMQPYRVVQHIKDADLVMFPGGSDINPALYGEPVGVHTHFWSSIDSPQVEDYKEAITLGKKIYGSCRGAQLICAMQPNGKLIQHVRHPGYHDVLAYNRKEPLQFNSIHHQMQYPFLMNRKDYRILAYCNISPFHLNGNEEEMNTPKECEVIFYPKTQALAAQHHPEWMDFNSPANMWMREVLAKMMAEKEIIGV